VTGSKPPIWLIKTMQSACNVVKKSEIIICITCMQIKQEIKGGKNIQQASSAAAPSNILLLTFVLHHLFYNLFCLLETVRSYTTARCMYVLQNRASSSSYAAVCIYIPIIE